MLDLPALRDAQTLTEKAHAILDAVAHAQCPPDVARDLLSGLANVTRILEIDEILTRLDALEEYSDSTRATDAAG
jgi:hypothetical protein